MKKYLTIAAIIFFTGFNCIAQTPEINVRGNGLTIVDGDLIPTTADHSDFGSVLACNGTILRTFTIQNLGTGDLNITTVFINGANPGDFTLVTFPSWLISAGGSTILQISFDPSATGMRSAVVTIDSDDADEAAYDFGIQGTGNADIVNPTITCTGNISVSNSPGQCGAIVNYTAPIGTDNCPSSTTTQIAGLPSGSQFPVGVTVNTFRVTDGSGNTATCSFSVTVTDTEAPVLYTTSCGPLSDASATPYTDGWQSGDNEPTATGFSAWTLTTSTGNTAQTGFLRASSTTNGAGTDSNGDQDIDVSGLAFGIYANSAQAAEAVRPFLAPLANGSSVSAEFDNGSVDPGQIVGFQIQNSSGNSLGEIRYRGGQAGYEIVDANGITPFTLIPFTDEGIIIEVTSLSTGLASIKLTRKVNGATQTIISTLLPGGGNQLIRRVKIFNSNAGSGTSKNLFVNKLKICTSTPGCPVNVNVSNDAGVCGATVVYNTLLAADNCSAAPVVTQTSGLPSGSVFPVGITTNSFSATDGAGNTSTCSFTVTVNDVEVPTAICNDTTLYIAASGNLIITPAAIDLGSSDVCGIASMSVFPNTFNCSQMAIGEPITLTVTDVNGNSATCVSLVNIFDNLSPVAICQNITAYLDVNGDLSITPAMVNNGSYDECGIVSMNISPNTFNCSNIGANNVTLSVFDSFGQSSSCTAVVTVLDTIAPVANCYGARTFYLSNTTGTHPMVPGMLDNGSYDNCGIASMSVSPNILNCTNEGIPTIVTLTITDNSGNISTCTSLITVLDSMRPTANCYSQTVYLNNVTGTISLVPGMIDNGSTDNCGITSRTISPNNFNCANIGTNTVTLTVTDASGNSSTCNTVLTVADSMHPTAICQNFNLYLNPPFATANIIPAMTDFGSYDNCGIAWKTVSPNNVNCSNVGPTNVTMTVMDVNGNSSTCISVVTVLDSLRPVANCQNITVTLNASGTASITGAMVNNGSTDQCGIASMSVSPSTFNCSNVGPNNVVFTVTDIHGNSSACNAIVTVVSGLSETITVNNHVNCFGGNDGHATAIPSGGSGTYTYSWLPSGGTGATSNGLSAGTYTCNIVDANGCTSTQTITITQPTNPLWMGFVSQNNVSCSGGSNGTAQVSSAVGGTSGYAYNWTPGNPAGDGTTSVTGLTVGIWTCTVTDANGCTYSRTINITEPSVLNSSSSATSILCNGGNSTVTVTGSGGTSPYSGTGTFTVSAGTYSYTVTDNNSCTSTTTITVTEPTVLSSSSSATSILCNGGNATVTVNGSGGTSPYSGTGTFTVSAGTYSYTVTDNNACTSTTIITVTEPTVLSSSSSATSILCNGGNATVTVTGSGGTSPYSGTGTFTVSAGTYSYTVTDNNSCTSTTTITITEPTVLNSSSSATSILCNGGNSTVTVNGSGGTSPYSGTGIFTVSAGTYSYTVTDNNSCTSTTTITVTEPSVLNSSSSATSILCNGGNSTVTVNGSGGTSPYSGTGTFTVNAGTYSYTVTDNHACTSTTTITISEPTAISTSVVSVNVLCNGGATGSIDLSVSGGTSPYTFDWNSGTYLTEDISGLSAGNYVGVLTDANGCTDGGTIVITEPGVLVASVTLTTDPSTCSGTNGSVDITVNGGTPVYTFLWNTSATTEDIIGLGAGAYNCAITDANGCTTTATANLNDPNAPVVTLALTLDTACQTTTAPFVLTGESPTGGIFSGSGVTGNTFDPMTANLGFNLISYTYTDINGCTGNALDSIYVDICIGVVVVTDNINFMVMPNPNNGTFMLQLNTIEAADVLIYDALGQLVSKQKVQPKTQQQLNILNSGIYMITVITADGQRSVQRVIVNR